MLAAWPGTGPARLDRLIATLYAVRDAQGRFKDIQTFERAHRADLARKSKAGDRKS
jgi:hypothetical protein